MSRVLKRVARNVEGGDAEATPLDLEGQSSSRLTVCEQLGGVAMRHRRIPACPELDVPDCGKRICEPVERVAQPPVGERVNEDSDP